MEEWRIEPADWATAVASCDGPQLVVAGPGAGKTEFLVRRARYLLEAQARPEELLLLSFSRRSAAGLGTRVRDAVTTSFTELPALTFHALAYRLCEAYGGEIFGWERPPQLLTTPEQVALVGELLASEDPSDWPDLFRPMLPTRTFAEEVTDFILRAREYLIGTDELAAIAATRDDWDAMPAFLGRYSQLLESRRRIDYGTLQAKAVELLSHDGVADHVATRHRYLLVDEYQDTTVAQATLLRLLYRPHRNITVAGDPYQSIYSFRGAELHNIDAFPDAFPHADGAPARRLVLTTSFRVPTAILEAAVRVTAGGELPGSAGPVQPAPGGGAVEAYVFSQQSQEADWIASEIERLHLVERIPYSRVAVLVRSKRRFLPELHRALRRRGIPADRSNERLADHPAVRSLLDCVIAATEDDPERSAAVRRLLLGSLFALELGRARELERTRLSTGSDWSTVLGDDAATRALGQLLAAPAWANQMPAAAGFWELWTKLPQFGAVATDTERSGERAALSSLSQALRRLQERDPVATLSDYVAWVEDDAFEATPLLAFHGDAGDQVTITTLHQGKGLDFDTVFIADAVEGVFPDLRARESILRTRRLSMTQPESREEYLHFRLQEEMRLAYTAMCRAGRRVVWTATESGLDEEKAAPSRFLFTVANGSNVGPPSAAGTPRLVTPLEVEAHLRTTAGDPHQPAARRLAAVHALLQGPDHGLRPPATFSGILERGSDAGLVPEGSPLSPSQAETYLACPRRYALERRLRIGDDTSIYATFGSLIHDVLEQVERAAMDRGDPHADEAEALSALDDHWDPGLFGGEPWASSWLRRGRDALERLYGSWPSAGTPIGLETDLELEIDGRLWKGRADRIERVSDGLKVVDYKTSRNPVYKKDAAVSVQLAFYAMAVQHSPVGGVEPVTAAEFWYPAAPTKNVTIRAFDLARFDEARELMTSAAVGIETEEWEPRPSSSCSGCHIRLLCPAWPEGIEAFRS